MIDINYIRNNSEEVIQNCHNRRVSVDIPLLLRVDEQRRALIQQVDELRAQKNKTSKGKPSEEDILAMKSLGETLKIKETELATCEQQWKELMLQVPNRTHPETPVGEESAFRVVVTKGSIPEVTTETKDHEELMLALDMIDFDRGTKVTGTKFYFLKNDAVLLNQALINYGLSVLMKHGYTIMETPDLAKHDVIRGIGFNPRGEETQIYNIENQELSLIGTAEITIGGYHMNEVVDLSQGPKKYAAISHCFRTEAGAYGRTSKGMYRVHQFTKLEMFIFCRPEESDALHEELLAIEQEICDGLQLSYRVIDIPSADLGGPAYRKFDIEAYMTMKQDYGEITSTSNCTDYQSRRLNIKYKQDDGSLAYVHTLNGTAIVLSRFPIAIIEQYQQPDGSIKIPSVLVPYMGKEYIIGKQHA